MVNDSSEDITADMLAKQDSVATAAIIKAYEGDEQFLAASQRLANEIMARDNEDGEKLQKGIQLAIDKEVLSANVQVEDVTKIQVAGKNAGKICEEIVVALGTAPSKGCVLTLQGLSGTGKGTTVAKLQESLPSAQTWSNGNLFRSITLLAVTHAEAEGIPLTEALERKLLAAFMEMLEFGKFNGKFDVKIEGLGLKYFVSDIEKTILKESRVSKNIPTVAEVTQGEVINFVQVALGKMTASGVNVILEGREQTLNYIRTSHRFELVLNDNIVIGMRQAALLMAAKADTELKTCEDKDFGVKIALERALQTL